MYEAQTKAMCEESLEERMKRNRDQAKVVDTLEQAIENWLDHFGFYMLGEYQAEKLYAHLRIDSLNIQREWKGLVDEAKQKEKAAKKEAKKKKK